MTSLPPSLAVLALLGLAAPFALAFNAEDQKPTYGYRDTPYLPGGQWRVHDADRPLPPVVDPGTPDLDPPPSPPPSDAIVLFDGSSLDHWHGDGGKPAPWKVEDGAIVIVPRSGSLISNQSFGDCQIHLEFQTPSPPEGSDQGRGNSGLLIMSRYEIQILDNYNNPTYADGHAGAVYGQTPPLVNACRPPGRWQTFDIIWRAPRFKPDGSLDQPAFVTVFHNGILVQDHTQVLGPVRWRDLARYEPGDAHGDAPILLQDHGDPVRFRNIWVRPLSH
ncbi:MAG: hypothetical protein KatS3mg108_0241 [Isosphaeraceae bacterium]|jgi:hypothetical protein|nr:MAG: hypothetical protein KatS3mg108_0241 [Isosphaeraceae bacterium]